MGSSVRASCLCGFSAVYPVGGALRSHLTQSYFPYRCSPCGLISVNIAAEELICPRNQTHKLTRIAGSRTDRLQAEVAERKRQAANKSSFWHKFRLSKRAASQEVCAHPRVICEWGDHELYDQPYDCPYCRQKTMFFSSTGVRFD